LKICVDFGIIWSNKNSEGLMQVRRSDREITDKVEIVKIIGKCDVCRLAFVDGEIPYIVPMNYGFSYNDEKLILYFHGASEGRKHNIILKNPNACFVIDCSHKLIEAEEAANYTMEYESVIGTGKISYITEKSEKTVALTRLMKQYVKDKDFAFLDNVLETVTVLKLEVSEFTGKRLRRSSTAGARG
jgi:nitroimidazol reductase NimA-like FMN-containing flavoprotein (pyridoxamine 5'-phosphate oxidase superfamily)